MASSSRSGTTTCSDLRPGPRRGFLSYPRPNVDAMASWREIEQDAAEFAAKVKARFDAGTNKTIATLRRDGSPRISASEAQFRDGELTFGMMGGSMKLLDVRRDPRLAMHSPTIEPPAEPALWPGDAKVAGIAVEIPSTEED